MKSLKLLLLGVLIVGTATMSSCVTEGCTDPDAKTYDSTAGADDGSCLYEGTVVFWYGQSISNLLGLAGAQTLTYYVDNQIIGYSSADVYWTSAPDCGTSGSVTYTRDLGAYTSGTSVYQVVDQDGWIIWSDYITFTANTCEAIQLN